MKHHLERGSVGDGANALGVSLSPRQVESLQAFESLILERAVPGGMVADADAARLRSRHILDCLRAAVVIRESDRAAYDLGSGAGLPGIVVAVACAGLSIGLVETRARRAAFLELAVERLGLENARVLRSRVEDLTERVDVCLARALAPLPHAWELAEPLLRPGGRLVYFAGHGAQLPSNVAGRTPDMVHTPVLERSGPLVIMAR